MQTKCSMGDKKTLCLIGILCSIQNAFRSIAWLCNNVEGIVSVFEMEESLGKRTKHRSLVLERSSFISVIVRKGDVTFD